MDYQFVTTIIENAIGGALAAAACAAFRSVSRLIAGRLMSVLRNGPDAERAREEILGMMDELDAPARAGFLAGLFLRFAALSREIAERAHEREAATHAAEGEPDSSESPATILTELDEFSEFRKRLRQDHRTFVRGNSSIFVPAGAVGTFIDITHVDVFPLPGGGSATVAGATVTVNSPMDKDAVFDTFEIDQSGEVIRVLSRDEAKLRHQILES